MLQNASLNLPKSIFIVSCHTIRLVPSRNHSYSWWFLIISWLSACLSMGSLPIFQTFVDLQFVWKRYSVVMLVCKQLHWFHAHFRWSLFSVLVHIFNKYRMTSSTGLVMIFIIVFSISWRCFSPSQPQLFWWVPYQRQPSLFIIGMFYWNILVSVGFCALSCCLECAVVLA